MAYGEKKKFDLAIADFTEAIRLKPDEGDPYFGRAGVYASQEKKDLVIADFEKFLELAPNDKRAEETREILEGLKNGKIALNEGRIVDIDAELRKRSIPIIILNFIPIIPIVNSFVWVWNGWGWDPVGLKDDFKCIADKDTWTLGDGIPVLHWIFDIAKSIADAPDSGFVRVILRLIFLYFRLGFFWGPLLGALVFASPIIGIVRGIKFLAQRGKIKKLAARG
jgi:tetratricopeptide (TPR) repeat protein